MYTFSVGVMLHNFHTTPEEGLKKARALNLDGVQIGGGIIRDTPVSYRKELLNIAKGEGLKVSALCGGGDFLYTNYAPGEQVETTKWMLDNALLMETNIVTSHIGVVPADPTHTNFLKLQDDLGQVGEYAKSIGAVFAVETGPESAVDLKRLLDTLPGGIGVNLDPANLVMCVPDDPVAAVYTLQDYIVHTHAKDGVQLPPRVSDDGVVHTSYREYPLGQGNVDFPNYLKALDEIGFHGFLTIERETGENPAADIALAADFLRAHF